MPTTPPKKVPSGFKIPTLPAIAMRVQRLADDPSVGTREIGTELAQDAPLSAKVLRIVNSAYYGLAEPCLSAEQACTVLGASALRNAVTQVAIIRQFEHLRSTGFDVDGLWRHSILTAQACERLARRTTDLGLKPTELYSCGLLHDIGKVVLLDRLGERYADILREAELSGEAVHLAEEHALGANHTGVGAAVAESWGLPIPAVAAIQFHHGPREMVRDSKVVSLVAHANLLVNAVCEGEEHRAEAIFDEPTRAFLGLELDDVTDTATWLAEQKSSIEV